jgi:hypothetical protein
MAKKKIDVQGFEIRVDEQESGSYISLTDLAKGGEGEVSEVIRRWLRAQKTIDFLGVWEKVHNPDFNLSHLGQIKIKLSRESYYISVKKWVEETNAMGIEARPGRYGGTYAHSDIAIHFANWLSPEFYVYLIKEFQRLKSDEAAALDQPWNVNRYLSKINYYIHNDAVKTDVVPLLDQNTKRQNVFFAIEANRLNEIVFGMTAKQWQAMNPDKKGNMRDHATTIELQVLANIEVLNAELIKIGMSPDERHNILSNAAERHTNIIEEREQKTLKKGK